MKMASTEIFCDFLTVSQYHDTQHPAFNAGIKSTIDEHGDLLQITPVPKSLKGDHGSNLQISSDGNLVRFSGNPSRWNRSENYHGLSLDQAKTVANKILASVNLPIFTSGRMLRLSDGTKKYTGATFSRIDMTANIKTGSKLNAAAYLQYQQTQSYPVLEKQLIGTTTYHGKESDSRTIKMYDKAEQLKKVVLPKTDEPEYLSRLIEWTEKNGIIRFEVIYRRFLRAKKKQLRLWHRATQENLTIEIEGDIDKMTPQIKAPDYDEIPNSVLGTLTMYMAGINVKERLTLKTYYKHRKILKKFGYDISNQNIHLLQPKVKIITLEPAGVPDFYKHATMDI